MNGNDKIELNFNIDTSYPSILKDEIVIDIRGAKSLVIPIKAEIIVPNIEINVDKIEYGEITVGKKVTKQFTLSNNSKISSTL